MTPGIQWLSLLGGIVLLIIGARNLYLQHDPTILVISVLIIAFTIARMYKSKQGK
jgi:hypothetical protein